MEKPAVKEVKEIKRAPVIAVRRLEFVVAEFEDLERAIKDKTEVYLWNPKKQTSVRGFLLEWVNRDEGFETALFRTAIKRKFCKVHIGNIYITKKVMP